MAKLGDKIKQLRIEKGMTQEELAAYTGTTKSSISNYECNKRKPQYDILCVIAEALGTPVGEFAEFVETENPIKSQIGIKHPRRVKKLMDAFCRLSDEAQMKAIERVEELGMIPMYQRKLVSVLQRYISSNYQTEYELLKDTEARETYMDDFEPEIHEWIWNVRHIVLQRGTKPNQMQRWDFFYYSFDGAVLGSSVVRQILSKHGLPEFCEDLSFVFDDDMVLDSFYSCYADQHEYAGMEDFPTSYKPTVLFFLVDKDTLEIKDVQEYDPNI